MGFRDGAKGGERAREGKTVRQVVVALVVVSLVAVISLSSTWTLPAPAPRHQHEDGGAADEVAPSARDTKGTDVVLSIEDRRMESSVRYPRGAPVDAPMKQVQTRGNTQVRIERALEWTCRNRGGLGNWAISVGAHYGDLDVNSAIHLTSCDWNALFVEAAPTVFAKLQASSDEHHALHPESENGRRIEFLGVGIGPERGTLPFYYLVATSKTEAQYVYSTQAGSFSKRHAVNHLHAFSPKVSDPLELRESLVEVYPPDNILSHYGIRGENVSAFFIDTEGYDCQVILQLPLDRMRPAMLVFERKHCPESDLEAAVGFLLSYRYKLFAKRVDIFAVPLEVAEEVGI